MCAGINLVNDRIRNTKQAEIVSRGAHPEEREIGLVPHLPPPDLRSKVGHGLAYVRGPQVFGTGRWQVQSFGHSVSRLLPCRGSPSRRADEDALHSESRRLRAGHSQLIGREAPCPPARLNAIPTELPAIDASAGSIR